MHYNSFYLVRNSNNSFKLIKGPGFYRWITLIAENYIEFLQTGFDLTKAVVKRRDGFFLSFLWKEMEYMETEIMRSAKSITEYKNSLFMFRYMLNSTDSFVSSDDFRNMLRGFFWYSHDPLFEDLYDVCRASLPVLNGYILSKVRQEGLRIEDYPLSDVTLAARVLENYIGRKRFELDEDRESVRIIAMPCYTMEDDLKDMKHLLSIDPGIEKTENDLKQGATDEFKNLLEGSPALRIERLKEKLGEVAACKNCIYNIIRKIGDRLLTDIELSIFALHPADQDIVLRGLDAFTGNNRVMDFYERFLETNRYKSLIPRVLKCMKRVKNDGTTGLKTKKRFEMLVAVK
jgi:hypothetical protein